MLILDDALASPTTLSPKDVGEDLSPAPAVAGPAVGSSSVLQSDPKTLPVVTQAPSTSLGVITVASGASAGKSQENAVSTDAPASSVLPSVTAVVPAAAPPSVAPAAPAPAAPLASAAVVSATAAADDAAHNGSALTVLLSLLLHLARYTRRQLLETDSFLWAYLWRVWICLVILYNVLLLPLRIAFFQQYGSETTLDQIAGTGVALTWSCDCERALASLVMKSSEVLIACVHVRSLPADISYVIDVFITLRFAYRRNTAGSVCSQRSYFKLQLAQWEMM